VKLRLIGGLVALATAVAVLPATPPAQGELDGTRDHILEPGSVPRWPDQTLPRPPQEHLAELAWKHHQTPRHRLAGCTQPGGCPTSADEILQQIQRSRKEAEGKTAPGQERVRFDGATLFLAWQGDTPVGSVKEYILDGGRLQSWTKLASIREFVKPDDPKAMAADLLGVVKQQNPGSQGAAFVDTTTGAVVVDFVTWLPDRSFVEFNVFKFTKKEGGGLLGQQYAVRAYRDITSFMEGLKSLRSRLVELMFKTGLEVDK
jgi:hypothetical protein